MSFSPAYLLLAAFICSMIGRALLIRAAWEISKPWGIAVLCVPFAPMFFRMNYKELAHEGKGWRTMTTVFMVSFMAITGSRGSMNDLWAIVPEKFRPAEMVAKEAPESAPASAEDAADGSKQEAAPAKSGFFTRIKDRVTGASPAEETAPAKPTVVATNMPATTSAPAATPAPPTLAERMTANQQEFARLSEVYDNLKIERSYLKKWDQDAIKAYNEQAAKYQAALTKARADQTDINKQLTLAKK